MTSAQAHAFTTPQIQALSGPQVNAVIAAYQNN